jgi:hypothetical protein
MISGLSTQKGIEMDLTMVHEFRYRKLLLKQELNAVQ